MFRKITVHDTNPFVFRVFLEYLYSGRLRQSSLTTDQFTELLLLSDRYEVDSLKQACEYGLHSSIDEDSVLYFLSMADQYNAKTLRVILFQIVESKRFNFSVLRIGSMFQFHISA